MTLTTGLAGWQNIPMTERKPAGTSFESWVDQQIREAQDRGEFDNLPGAGKPLTDLDTPYHELWVKRQLERDDLPTDALLPPSLLLRKEIERLPEAVRELPEEEQVRDAVRRLNERILAWMREPSGPRVQLRPVNADRIVEGWRAARRTGRGSVPAGAASVDARADAVPTQRQQSDAGNANLTRWRRWWNRIVHA